MLECLCHFIQGPVVHVGFLGKGQFILSFDGHCQVSFEELPCYSLPTVQNASSSFPRQCGGWGGGHARCLSHGLICTSLLTAERDFSYLYWTLTFVNVYAFCLILSSSLFSCGYVEVFCVLSKMTLFFICSANVFSHFSFVFCLFFILLYISFKSLYGKNLPNFAFITSVSSFWKSF